MSTPARCQHHPAVLAQGACGRCGIPLCSACSEVTLKQELCHACAEKHRTATAIKRGLTGLGLLAALGGAGWLGYQAYLDHPLTRYGELANSVEIAKGYLGAEPCDPERAAALVTLLVRAGSNDEIPALSKDFDDRCAENPDLWFYSVGAHRALGQEADADRMLARLEAHPLGRYAPNAVAAQAALSGFDVTGCDKGDVLELANTLFELDAHGAVPAVSAGFDAACEAYPRLWWKVHFAHTELEEWAAAEAVATRLIERQPTDYDFWRWRAEPRAKQGNVEGAAMDFRQSIALLNMASSRGLAISGLGDIAEYVDRPCAPVFAAEVLTEAGQRLSWSAQALRDRLAEAGECGALAGQGAATVSAPFQAKGTINGAAVSVLVSPDSAVVSVRADRAEALGLVGAGEALEALVGGTLTRGQLARARSVSVEGAQAPEVDVLLAEEMPDGVDAVIGADFLHRFALAVSDEQVVLTARD